MLGTRLGLFEEDMQELYPAGHMLMHICLFSFLLFILIFHKELIILLNNITHCYAEKINETNQ